MGYDFSRAKESLSSIAVVKQDIFDHSYIAFETLRSAAIHSSDILASEMAAVDKRVQVAYKDVNKQEFWLQFGGDLLIFSLHSNVSRLIDHILYLILIIWQRIIQEPISV